MKNFMVVYHASAEAMSEMANATPEQKAEGMKPWMEWKNSVGEKLVDFGAPLAGGQRIRPDGKSESSGKEVAGYSILKARDMEEAKALLKDHPHLRSGGCDIEVHECIDM